MARYQDRLQAVSDPAELQHLRQLHEQNLAGLARFPLTADSMNAMEARGLAIAAVENRLADLGRV